MNVCVKCRHHEQYPLEPRYYDEKPASHWCVSLDVRRALQDPVAGIPRTIVCVDANPEGKCKHWDEGEFVSLEVHDREVKSSQNNTREVTDKNKTLYEKNQSLKDTIDILKDRLRQRRWWRRGR